MAQPARSKATRRDFLKLAAGATGVAAGPWVSRHAQAKPVSITFARESSYVKNFDVHFQNVMAPAYEKATGIKIEYQIQAAGGSAVPQLVSMVENKSGADLAWVQQEWLYRDALVDVSDIAEAVGKQQGAGTTRSSTCQSTTASGSPCPTRTSASAWSTERIGSTRSGSRDSPRPGTSSWKPASSSRPRATRTGCPWGTASRTTTPGSTPCCGPTGRRSWTRTARRSLSTPAKPRAPWTSCASCTRRPASKTAWGGWIRRTTRPF